MRLNYLTGLRDQLGLESEEIELQPSIATVAHMLEWLATRGDRFKNAFTARNMVYVTGNGKLLTAQDSIASCDHLTFFSPIVGG